MKLTLREVTEQREAHEPLKQKTVPLKLSVAEPSMLQNMKIILFSAGHANDDKQETVVFLMRSNDF